MKRSEILLLPGLIPFVFAACQTSTLTSSDVLGEWRYSVKTNAPASAERVQITLLSGGQGRGLYVPYRQYSDQAWDRTYSGAIGWKLLRPVQVGGPHQLSLEFLDGHTNEGTVFDLVRDIDGSLSVAIWLGEPGGSSAIYLKRKRR